MHGARTASPAAPRFPSLPGPGRARAVTRAQQPGPGRHVREGGGGLARPCPGSRYAGLRHDRGGQPGRAAG